MIDLCPRTTLLGISCLLASWFQPIGGTTRRKEVRGKSYQVLISATPKLPPSQPMILAVAVLPYVCPLLLGSPFPTASAITGF